MTDKQIDTVTESGAAARAVRPTKKPGFGLLKFRRDTSGVAAVEFGMVAIPFFMMVFAIIELSFWFLGIQTLEHAVERAARKVRTGEAVTMTEAQFRTEVCSHIVAFLDCDDVILNVGPFSDFTSASSTDHTDADGNLDSNATGSFVSCPSSSVCIVQATIEWDMLLNIPNNFGSFMGMELETGGTNKKTIIIATSVLRVEPF